MLDFLSLQCRRILDARVRIFVFRPPSWVLVTVEVWGEEIFPEGVGVKGENGPTSPLHQSSTGQPSKMAASTPIYYLAFRSKITPALQARIFLEKRTRSRG